MTESGGGSRPRSIAAREILDSRGLPTLEVEIVLESGRVSRAAVPSGVSRGQREAAELRDGGDRLRGKGVQAAVRAVTKYVAPLFARVDVTNQLAIDDALKELDGTYNKADLGANTLLAVSMAIARAAALARRKPLYHAFGDPHAARLPLPLFTVIDGGMHVDNLLDIQEIMVVPVGATTFHEALGMGMETYLALGDVLRGRGYSTAVGDEGGFAPQLADPVHAIELVLQAIELASFVPGRQVAIAIDVAASTLHKDGRYVLRHAGRSLSSEEIVSLYQGWLRQFPIVSLEDGVADDDRGGWQLMTEKLGDRVQLVGDDVFATHAELLRDGVQGGVGNAAVIKLNQVGTVSETIETMGVARAAHYAVIVSHRSGETNDDFIADFAVGTSAGQIKAGAPCRGERVAKYNRLLRIEEELGGEARFAGRRALARGASATAGDAPQPGVAVLAVKARGAST